MSGSNPYGGPVTPLAHVPPEVPPHGRPVPAGSQRRGQGPPRDSYCEQVSVVNMSLNQCASNPTPPVTSAKRTGVSADFHHPCEHEPLLAAHTAPTPLVAHAAPASLAAHVMPRSTAPLQMKHGQRLQQSNSAKQHLTQPLMKQQSQQTQPQFRSSSQHNKSHPRHDQQQIQSLSNSQQQNHHHHASSAHHHSHQSQKKWPVSSHFPDWDQREGSRAGASWKSQSAQARLVHPTESSQPVQHKHSCRAATVVATAAVVEASNPVSLVLPSLPKHYQVEEAGVRNKLRNLTRHYSDDSLHGSSNRELYSTRIHSSADEISSVNRSPSISSSDESFSRTDFSRTDADSPSPERAPSLNDVRFKYMFGDMSNDATAVPRFRELSPQLYSDYLSSVKASSDESSIRLNSLTLDSSNHSHHNISGSWRESDIGPQLTDSDRLRRDDLFIPKLTAEFSSDKVKRTKTDPSSSLKQDHNSLRKSASPMSDKLKPNFRSSFNESDMTSPLRGTVTGSAGRLLSLDRSSRGAGVRDNGVSGAPKRRSLPRDASGRRPGLGEHLSGRKTSSMREYDRKDTRVKSSITDKRTTPDRSKHNIDCQTEPKRSTHNRKASDDFERLKRLGSTFEGISEDPCIKASTSDRYEACLDSQHLPFSHSFDCCSPEQSSVCSRSPDCSVAQSLGSGSTLEGYSALHKLAKLQEDALLSSLDCNDQSDPRADSVMLGLHFDPQSKRSVLQLSPLSGMLSYETGKEGSLLR